jgi:tetratricopeptide (TPR) repeat protein
MRILLLLILAVVCTPLSAFAQKENGDFKLALADHNGRLTWSANNFEIIQSSAKDDGHEIGIRGHDAAGDIYFLGFLFVVSEEAHLNSNKCRDNALKSDKSDEHSLKVTQSSEIEPATGLPIAVADYSVSNPGAETQYSVRAFIAAADLCGDLEIYGKHPIHATDTNIKLILDSLQLDSNYSPQFSDTFVYAQVLYKTHRFAAAGPLFEQALAKLKPASNVDTRTMTRVVTDQAGMSYGISGNTPKARSIFEQAIATDPVYPMYYYNLACADAQEHKLGDARKHLQEAFDRKANVIHGESLPDPSLDDSFTPYRNNRQFWSFIESLHSN